MKEYVVKRLKSQKQEDAKVISATCERAALNKAFKSPRGYSWEQAGPISGMLIDCNHNISAIVWGADGSTCAAFYLYDNG